MRLFGRLLILLGLFLLIFGGFLVYQRYSPKKLEFSNFNPQITYASSNFPVRLVISNINVSLPIYPAQIKNGTWDSTTRGASYLISSAVPGQIGNSIIYGHNWTSLLGPLVKIKPNDKIQVVFDNGETKTFIVKYTTLVSPDETDIIKSTNDTRLTIYTCAGFLDSQRFVATAFLSE